MGQYFRMQLSDAIEFSLQDSFEIISYSRPLHHKEIPRLYSESFGELPWSDDWEDFDEFDPAGIFLARKVSGGDLVGYIICFKRRDFGYISVVAVSPSYRRRGIATGLLKKAVEYLWSLGLDTIKIDVEPTNMPALKAYEKFGFKIMETFED